ncbi:twin arginine translocase protein A [Ewingella americana]|uniref:Twin arginine translocase protein A n=1 Tax=Ewingella americana TaxID=41202 RepID=A0A377NG99_9GAMM|nr:twin arginine translocase protein A [Ewingella americana]
MEGLSITKLLVVGVLIVLLFGTSNCALWAEIWALRCVASRKP